MQRGFYLARIEDGGPLELYSNEGEVRCGTKEGVEYTLRFGRIASTGDSEASSDEALQRRRRGIRRGRGG